MACGGRRRYPAGASASWTFKMPVPPGVGVEEWRKDHRAVATDKERYGSLVGYRMANHRTLEREVVVVTVDDIVATERAYDH